MKKILTREITLLTPAGKVLAPIQIVYDDTEEIGDSPSVITLCYNGDEYKGYGTDYLWTDTFADLEIKLPAAVKIACCMTCRHGNMCPYGNVENELFCTKDICISNKTDMCDLFDQTDPFKERKVASFDFCNDFAYQREEFYTYNDYRYQLNKKKRKG